MCTTAAQSVTPRRLQNRLSPLLGRCSHEAASCRRFRLPDCRLGALVAGREGKAVSRLDRFSVAMIVLVTLFVAWVASQPRAPLSPAWQVERPVTSILQCSDGIRRVTWTQNIGSYEI